MSLITKRRPSYFAEEKNYSNYPARTVTHSEEKEEREIRCRDCGKTVSTDARKKTEKGVTYVPVNEILIYSRQLDAYQCRNQCEKK
jgi:DNA-directed RNA polymerase subunit RPC12/RpoP